MSTSNESAFPVEVYEPKAKCYLKGGLTKREYYAARAMQGLLSNGNKISGGYEPLSFAKFALALADALASELEKK